MYYLLFIDDSEDRHQTVEHELGEIVCVLHAFDYDEACAILSHEHIRLGMVCFDNDMGLGLDGNDVANFLMNSVDENHFPARAIVHSQNAYAAENIASKCRAMDIPVSVRPFSFQMVKQLKLELSPQ